MFDIFRMDWKLTGVDTMSEFGGPIVIPVRDTLTDTGFAFAMGGGVDLRCSRRIPMRLIQADYLKAGREVAYDKSIFSNPFMKDSAHNGLGISTGIVVSIGKR
jgi:hypothetical protein